MLEHLAQRGVRGHEDQDGNGGQARPERGEGHGGEHRRVNDLVRAGDADRADVGHPRDVEHHELDEDRGGEDEMAGASAGGGAHVTGQDVTPPRGAVKDSCA